MHNCAPLLKYLTVIYSDHREIGGGESSFLSTIYLYLFDLRATIHDYLNEEATLSMKSDPISGSSIYLGFSAFLCAVQNTKFLLAETITGKLSVHEVGLLK